jgi:hypothetical protein
LTLTATIARLYEGIPLTSSVYDKFREPSNNDIKELPRFASNIEGGGRALFLVLAGIAVVGVLVLVLAELENSMDLLAFVIVGGPGRRARLSWEDGE